MARMLLLRTGSNKPFRCYYGARAEWIRAGMGKDILTNEYYPDMEILYPSTIFRNALQIVQEMEHLMCVPEVSFDQKVNPSYVAIVFRVKPLRSEFLRSVFPQEYPYLRSEMLNKEGELLMTGEAEFDPKDLQCFTELYQRKQYFRLILLEQLEGVPTPAWAIQLSHISYAIPGVL